MNNVLRHFCRPPSPGTIPQICLRSCAFLSLNQWADSALQGYCTETTLSRFGASSGGIIKASFNTILFEVLWYVLSRHLFSYIHWHQTCLLVHLASVQIVTQSVVVLLPCHKEWVHVRALQLWTGCAVLDILLSASRRLATEDLFHSQIRRVLALAAKALMHIQYTAVACESTTAWARCPS